MPIKRRDRDNEVSKSFRMEHIPTDHELFLQAFESKWFLIKNFHLVKYFYRDCIVIFHLLIENIPSS